LDIPNPRVLKWSAKSQNAVGAEYIFEEKSKGVPLSTVWYTWSKDLKLNMVEQIAKIERKLSLFEFSKHGAIYFREDLQGESLSECVQNDDASTKAKLSNYILGPVPTSELWDKGRALMDLDRGPCQSA
jgi:hypothetical protein